MEGAGLFPEGTRILREHSRRYRQPAGSFVFVSASERVPEEGAVANRIRGTEAGMGGCGSAIIVVGHEIEPGLRTDKEIMKEVKAKACPSVDHKVVAAHVVRAVSVNVAIERTRIEPDVLSSTAAQNLQGKAVINLVVIHCVERPENRPIRNLVGIQPLGDTPIHFALHAQIVPE